MARLLSLRRKYSRKRVVQVMARSLKANVSPWNSSRMDREPFSRTIFTASGTENLDRALETRAGKRQRRVLHVIMFFGMSGSTGIWVTFQVMFRDELLRDEEGTHFTHELLVGQRAPASKSGRGDWWNSLGHEHAPVWSIPWEENISEVPAVNPSTCAAVPHLFCIWLAKNTGTVNICRSFKKKQLVPGWHLSLLYYYYYYTWFNH